MRLTPVLTAGLIAFACAVLPLPAEATLLDDAKSLIETGNLKTALIQLKRAAKEDPTSAEARFQLGTLELRLGDMIAAERDLGLAKDYKYPIAKVNPLLAVALLAQGKYPQLLTTVEPCPDDAQCRSDVLAARTRAHLAKREVEEADTDSKGAVEAVPTNLPARIARTLVLITKSDYLGAEAMIDSVLAVNNGIAEALMLKGDLRRQANDLEGAVTHFKASLTAAPKDVTVRQRLALALAALGRNDEAQAEVNRVLEQAPQAVIALYLKALLEVRNGKMTAAMDTVRPIEAAIAGVPRGIFLLAIVHAANDHMEQAIAYATKFRSMEPDNLASSKLLANLYLRTRAYSRVIETLAPLQERMAEDTEGLQLLGSAYMAEGWVKEANEVLAKVAKARPDDVMSQARLAVNQTRDASTREAGIRELESLVTANPQNIQIDLALLFSYVAANQYDQALDVATRMVKAQPDSPLPLTVRGSTYLAVANYAAAKADLELALTKNRDFVPAASYLSELAMRNDDFARARAILDDPLSRNPSELRLLMARARIEAQANQPDAMIPYLQRAIAAHPEESEPRVQLVQLFVGLGRAQDAEQAATDLARSQARNPTAIDQAARAFMALKKTDRAIALYQELQNNFPASPKIHERTAQALSAVGRDEEARVSYDRAVSADRTYMPAWIGRAMLELRLSGFDAAKDIADKALVQNPKDEAAQLLLGDLLVAAKRVPEAEAAYTAVLARTPSSLAVSRLYRLYLAKGDRPRAEGTLSQWLTRHPDDHAARLALAEGVLAAGDYKGASGHYELLASKMPRNPVVLNNLAWVYDRLNDPRAIETARKAHELTPGSAEVLDTYAYLLYRKGDSKLGIEMERRAYKGGKGNPEIAYHMAKMLADAKDTAGALEMLKPVIEGKAVFAEREEARQLYTQLGGH